MTENNTSRTVVDNTRKPIYARELIFRIRKY